jgi:hypothetical protein
LTTYIIHMDKFLDTKRSYNCNFFFWRLLYNTIQKKRWRRPPLTSKCYFFQSKIGRTSLSKIITRQHISPSWCISFSLSFSRHKTKIPHLMRDQLVKFQHKKIYFQFQHVPISNTRRTNLRNVSDSSDRCPKKTQFFLYLETPWTRVWLL